MSRAVKLYGHDVYQLPLLGSNQDSPDPESRQRPPPTGQKAPESVGIAPNPARSTHENTHDFTPVVPSAFDCHDIVDLPLEEFLAEQARRVNEWHKATEARRAAEPERPRKRRKKGTVSRVEIRRSSLLKQYGITPAEYDALFAAQGGLCAICRKGQTARRLAVDHCHTTSRVRGLLCTSCNTGIGQFKEDPGLFARALFYLEQHKQAGAA